MQRSRSARMSWTAALQRAASAVLVSIPFALFPLAAPAPVHAEPAVAPPAPAAPTPAAPAGAQMDIDLNLPDWTFLGGQTGAELGTCVAPAGDVNGDGYSDVLIGAPNATAGFFTTGKAFLFLGSAEGPGASPAWSAAGGQSDCRFGASVAPAGDVNGDGYADFLVGAPDYSNGQAHEGRVYCWYGSPTGPHAAPDRVWEADQAEARFGTAIATAGDLDADGYDDVLIGAPFFDGGQVDEGRVFVYSGSASGLPLVATTTREGNQAESQYGGAVATAGDVNADGYADVVVGAPAYTAGEPGEGAAFLYLGSSSGLEAHDAWSGEGDQEAARYGASVAGAGDVDGDGYGDLLIGAWHHGQSFPYEGGAFLYRGSASGPSTQPDWSMHGGQASSFAGCAVATAGDWNGDGFADLLVGQYYYSGYYSREGAVRLYYGSPDGPSPTPSLLFTGGQADSFFGFSCATAGDVDGDGRSDLLVGAHHYDAAFDGEGRACLYYGTSEDLGAAPDLVLEGDPAVDWFGPKVAYGDWNGDGYSDLAVGSLQLDDTSDPGRVDVHYGSASGLSATPGWVAAGAEPYDQFGYALASAGDLNGDGYEDLVVGAPRRVQGADKHSGHAFVYFGSADGLASEAGWSTMTPEQDESKCGTAVASAGDVNGDGYGDLLVGAPWYYEGTLRGGAFLFLGSPSGPSASPERIWMGSFGTFGTALACAGDINRDGYSDVVVGEPEDDTLQGRIFLYMGGPAGPGEDHDGMIIGQQLWCGFGASVASAGDVDGDGYSDVIVGSPNFNGQDVTFDVGRVDVFRGSVVGLLGQPIFTILGDQESGLLGAAVASAGDVNHDGLSDILISEHGWDWDSGVYFAEDAGRARVFLGPLDAPASWVGHGTHEWENYSVGLCGPGDVNGDGFADVAIGSYEDAGGAGANGNVRLYCGNARPGTAWNARQARAGGGPVALLGSSLSDQFRLAVTGGSPMGRGRVRIEIEVKPLQEAFDGANVHAGPWTPTGTPHPGSGSRVALDDLATGLAEDAAHHWRLRISAASPYFPHSIWLSPAGNSATETDLRTGSPTVSVDDAPGASAGRLFVSGANPFVSATALGFVMTETEPATVTIHDASGRRIARLFDGDAHAGSHALAWDGRDASGNRATSGVYFARLSTPRGAWAVRLTRAR